MSEQWDFYLANVDEKVASVYLNLALRDAAPDLTRPWLLCIWVYLNHPSPDGLSTSEESSVLFQIEDALLEAVGDGMEAIYVGRITTDAQRIFYFHAASFEGFEDVVGRGMSTFPAYKTATHHDTDADWEHYLEFLYPSPHDLQRMQNRHVILELEKAGDPLETARKVSHWIYFEREQDRKQFAAEVVTRGFAVLGEQEAERSRE